MNRLLLLLLLLTVPVAAACGEKEDVLRPEGSTRIELMLDYLPNADHAPIYAAEAAGHFEEAGIDVEIRQPPDPAAPLKQLAAGRVDLAISYEPEVFRARDQGLNVVSVGALVQRPLTSIISLPKARIREPADLEGATVGTAGIDYQSAYLRTILLEAGVQPSSVEERNVGFGLNPALLTGKVDATLGAFWNYEGVDLRRRGRKPRIIPVDEAGVPSYNELVLVANADALERDGGAIRAFVGALSRAVSDLRQDPDDAIEGLLDANPDLDPEQERAALKVTLPLFSPPEDKPFAWQDPQQWDAFGAWMEDNRLLEGESDPRSAFTNTLLPGAGL